MNMSAKSDTAMPRNVVGSRKSRTRDKLIQAAVACLGEFGFSATNMRMVAERAGVTQGPRQYYFPSPIDLYVAVVDQIHAAADEFVADIVRELRDRPIAERLEAVMKPAFENCGSVRHLAMLELKLASRGDVKLHEALHPRITSYEEATDQLWVELFRDTGLAEEDLIRIRSVVGASLRGLGIAIAAGEERESRVNICDTLTVMVLQTFADVSDTR